MIDSVRPSLGIRREDKDGAEQRAPLAPRHVARLVAAGVEVRVEPAANRIFEDADYAGAGAVLSDDLSACNVILGTKEIPLERLREAQAYCFFSHTIKGQPHNMPMLRRILQLGATLIDYERIVNAAGRRLIFFGRFAGLAGMLRSLWAYGRRLSVEGVETPLASLERAYSYPTLAEALAAVEGAGRRIREEGFPPGVAPFVCGIAGYGNVARGAGEVLDRLPVREVAPEDLEGLLDGGATSPREVYKVVFREEHVVAPTSPDSGFSLEDYYCHPERYRGRFDRFYPRLSLLVNANYWSPEYPRLVTLASLRALYDEEPAPRLRVIGDLACDIGGSIECTLRATTFEDPVYVYDPATGRTHTGFSGRGPVVLALDRLPNEFAREATEAFGDALAPFAEVLAATDFSRPLAELSLPAALRSALIAHQGALTPEYAYLGADVSATGSNS